MGLSTGKDLGSKVETDEEALGLPAQPAYDQGELRSAMSDAIDIDMYVSKALKALENEDYESVKGYLQDIESSMSTVISALGGMETGLSKFEEWGDAWKQHALDQPSEVLDMLEAQYASCLNQVTEIQADDSLSAKLADQKSQAVISSWGVRDQDLAAVILSVCKNRGDRLYQKRKGPQPVVPMETKIREITGGNSRDFF